MLILTAFNMNVNAVNTYVSDGFGKVVSYDDFENEELSESLWGSIQTESDGENTRAVISEASAFTYKTDAVPASYEYLSQNRAKYEFELFFNEAVCAEISFRYNDIHIPIISFNENKTAALECGTTFDYPISEAVRYAVYVSFDKGCVTLYQNGEIVCCDCPVKDGESLTPGSEFKINLVGNGIIYADNFRHSIPVYNNRQLTFADNVFSSSYDEGVGIDVKHSTKGVVKVEPASVNENEHKNVAVVYNSAGDEALTDSLLRGSYSIVNSDFQTSLLPEKQMDEMKKIVFDIDVCLRNMTKAQIQFVGHESVETRKAFQLITFNKDGYYSLFNGKKFAYTTKAWYSFRFYIDLEKFTYDACVNGTPLGFDIPISTSARYVLSCGIHLLDTQEEAAVEVDNLYYYSVNEEGNKRFCVLREAENKISVCHIEDKNSAVLIVAVYDENGVFREVNMCKNQTEGLWFYGADAVFNPTDKVYYMFWNGFETMTPINIKQRIK